MGWKSSAATGTCDEHRPTDSPGERGAALPRDAKGARGDASGSEPFPRPKRRYARAGRAPPRRVHVMSTADKSVASANVPSRPQMQIVVVGHVDHGKSTVVGRLLADTESLPQGKLEAVRRECERTGKPFEYAFLLDA